MARNLAAFLLLLPLSSSAAQSAEPEELNLASKSDLGRAFQVEVELKVGGELTVRDRSSAGDNNEKQDDAVNRLPMSVKGRLVYEEQRLSRERFARYYEGAEATIKVDKGGKTPSLSEERRLVIAHQAEGSRLVLGSAGGPLSREELDLIDVIGASTMLDGLLPGKKMPAGESWRVSASVMGPLLGLDSVTVCEVSNVVDESNASYVKFQVAGVVHGRVDGAETEFDLRGLGLFDRRQGCVTRLNLAIKENRKLGPATPGFVGVAKANIKRAPLKSAERLTEKRLAVAKATEPITQLEIASKDLGMRARHDRQWFAASGTRKSLSLRRVDKGTLVAQATFNRVPSKSAKNQPTLDKFESDVKASLGASFVDLVSSGQWTNQAGCHCLGVVARGRVEDVDLEWRHYLIMPQAGGHSISLTATLAVNDLAAVGGADKALADTLELISEKPAGVARKNAGLEVK